MAATGAGSPVFIDYVTVDSSSGMNSEEYRSNISAQLQSNASKLIGQCFILQQGKHTAVLSFILMMFQLSKPTANVSDCFYLIINTCFI